jgi:hypothetical protein
VRICNLHGAESFLRSRQLPIYSRSSQYFVDLEDSVLCSQEPSTSTHPEPDESSPYHPNTISLRSIFILSCVYIEENTIFVITLCTLYIVKCRDVSRQRFCKQVPSATEKHLTKEVLIETAFCTRSVQRGYKEDSWGNGVSSVRESVRKRVSWKEAAIKRGLERGSWRICTVRSRYQGTAGEDTAGWKT